MNSALKPALASAGVPQPGGQSSPAKGNVASVNHASVGHPQGAQNSLNHATNSNNLAVQNLTQHVPAPQPPPHAVPSMAPVSANMAQMAHNMSNHGNLSHVSQTSPGGAPAPAAPVPSPSKAPSTSAPLSLVAEKANASQPLALTRTLDKPEKKEPDSTGQANGTVDSPKTASNAPVTLKAQNPEPNKDKIDIAKTSPSTTKPPEKLSTPSTPLKPETASPAPVASQPAPSQVPTQPKVAAASEPSEKSPSKPAEPKPAPTADVAPTQSELKPVPEPASSEPSPPEKDKDPALAKQETPAEMVKPEPAKSGEKKEAEQSKSTEEKPKETLVKEKEKPEPPKKEDIVDAPVKVVEKEKVEIKKVDPKKESKPRSTLKLATVTPPLRKRRHVSPVKSSDGSSPAKKAEGDSTPSDARTKRNRTKVQLYQSPTPELAMATKLSASAGRSTPTKPNDDKLIVFYKNEYLAVRNAEGGFYVCQTMQNVYRSTRKIKIRWLSQDKKADPSGETYKPDFYDVTDMECVLTTLSLSRAAGGAQILRSAESARAASILQRALRAETSPGVLQLTPEHPDGLDLSLYTDESQLEKRARKRAASKSSPRNKDGATDAVKEETTPVKKARTTPKRSPKSTRKAKAPPPPPPPAKTNNNKRKSTGSTPLVPAAKTATAVVEKAKAAGRSAPKRTPPKPRPEPVVTPQRKGRRSAAKEAKSAPAPTLALAQPSPSTSTGKTGRRKPPARK